MALVMLNMRFVRPEDRGADANVRSNARYGATREGVQKLEATEQKPVMSDAEGMNYIANRHGVARIADDTGELSDGLFNAQGKANLEEEMQRLEEHPDSTEWRGVISFAKDDLERTSYTDPEAFRQLLTAKMPEIGKLYGISPQNLIWNAAYHPVDKHGRDHHPHYHVYFYSTDETEGRSNTVTVKQLDKSRSILTNATFPEDTYRIQLSGRAAREELNAATKKLLENPDWMLTSGMDSRLRALASELPKTGKKTYAFLPNPLKKKVDNLIREIIRQPGIADAYEKLESAQRDYVLAYNDKQGLIEKRMYEWQKHFFHPTGENDRATLHNRLIRLAVELGRDDLKSVGAWEASTAEDSSAASAEEKTETEFQFFEAEAEQTQSQKRAEHIERLAKQAGRGDANAAFWLSKILKKDAPELAAKYLNQAADRGSVDALRDKARETDDLIEQRDLLVRAVSSEEPRALYDLGKNAEKRGELSEATVWYEKAAGQNVWAALRLAALYAGDDVPDPERAEMYRRSASALLNLAEESTGTSEAEAASNAFARHQLGQLYQQTGKISDAVMEYAAAAGAGNADAVHSLARIYHHKGWMALLEQQESPEFMSTAKLLLKSYDAKSQPFAGFTPEFRQARQWVGDGNKAAVEALEAEAGAKNVLAVLRLAKMYEDGTLMELNPELAGEYYRRSIAWLKDILGAAPEKPDGYLEYQLGRLYLDGKGCDVDPAEAEKWLRRALKHECDPAKTWLARLLINEDALKQEASFVGGTDILKKASISEQTERIQQAAVSIRDRLIVTLPEDLREPLKDAVADRVLDALYYNHVSVVVTGIYKSAPVHRTEYQLLAAEIRCSDASVSDLSQSARDQLQSLMPVAASRADEAARVKMERAILQIATGQRMEQLLDSDIKMREKAIRITDDLRTAMCQYGHTKYGANLPEPVKEKLSRASIELAGLSDEFSAAATADPERWQRQVWNVAAKQLYTRTRANHFARGGIASLLLAAGDIGRMAMTLSQSPQQSNTQKSGSRNDIKSDRSDRNAPDDQNSRDNPPMFEP